MGNLSYCNGSYRVLEVKQVAEKRSYTREPIPTFNEKLHIFMKPNNLQKFCIENKLSNGDIIQVQNPVEKNLHYVDYGMLDKKHSFIEDLLVVFGESSGKFNFVAPLDKTKNWGEYQRRAKRVLESRTYLVEKSGEKFSLVELLTNYAWLERRKSIEAIKMIIAGKDVASKSKENKLEKWLSSPDGMETRAVKMQLNGETLHLKAARVQKFANGLKESISVVISLNSGKIWVLSSEKVELLEDVSGATFIMTNFVRLAGDGSANYKIVN